MNLSLDKEYAIKIGYQLTLFTSVDSGKRFNFRCPICGDSKKNKYKKRGWFYPNTENTSLKFKCFNCSETSSLANFIKRQDFSLYKQYNMEKFSGKNEYEFESTKNIKRNKEDNSILDARSIFEETKYLKKLSSLNNNHISIQYCKTRKMTSKVLNILYFTPNYYEFVKSIDSNTDLKKEIYNYQAIIIPLITEDGIEFGFQSRNLESNSKIRYNTFILDKRFTKAFGMDRIERNEDIWIVEGAFDALLFRNSIAALDSHLYSIVDRLSLGKEKVILLFDNEPRNKEIVKLVKKSINEGYRVAFIPKEFREKGKDINEIICNGVDKKELLEKLKENIFQNHKAQMEFLKWAKV